MRLFLDTEFNGHRLVSMALVDMAGREWYEVLDCAAPLPWVRQNVIPVLGKDPVTVAELQLSLAAWLSRYPSIHVIADWPEDIALFCTALITGPGQRVDTPPLTLEIRRDIGSEASVTPHNALSDARAIKAAYLSAQHKRGDDDDGPLPPILPPLPGGEP